VSCVCVCVCLRMCVSVCKGEKKKGKQCVIAYSIPHRADCIRMDF